MNDKQIKEKIQSLDTLSGGIVFGKEEAWEKLQARMEQKPVKKIPIRYWLAGAAMLLLFICVTGVYYYPMKEVAKNNEDKINSVVNNVAVTQPQTTLAIQRPETPVQKIVSTNGYNRHSKHVPKKEMEDKPETNNAPIVQAPLNENKVDEHTVMVNVSAPVTTVRKPMKTISINELDEKEMGQPVNITVAINSPTGIDLNHLPVVHINDVIHEEYEEQQVLKESRGSFVQISFMQHGYKYDTSTDLNDDETPNHLLKIKFNSQN